MSMSEHNSTEDDLQGEELNNTEDNPESLLATDFVCSHLDGSTDYTDVGAEVLITLLVLNIVANPTRVRVTVTKSVNTVILEFQVEDADKGRLIGSDGKTIISIRHLSRAVAGRSGKEYFIRMLEDGSPPNTRRKNRSRTRRSYKGSR